MSSDIVQALPPSAPEPLDVLLDLADLLDNTHDLVQSVLPDGRFLYTNRAWQQTLGYPPDAIARLTVWDVIHPDCRENCALLFRRCLSGETLPHVETQFVSRDGRTIWLEGPVSSRVEHGKVVTARGIFSDVTKRKLAEEKLRQEHAELEAVLRAFSDLYFWLDADGTIRRYHAGGPLYLPPENFLNMRMADALPPAVAEQFGTAINQVLATAQIASIEYPLAMPDGEHWYESRLTALPNQQIMAVVRDITDRRRMEEKLRYKTNIQKAVLNSVAEGVVVADRDAKFIIFNPAAEAILGRGAVDSPPEEWAHQYGAYRADGVTTFPLAENPLLRAIRGKESNSVEMYIQHPGKPDGIWINLSGRPIKDERGENMGGVVVFSDITERKRYEKQLAAYQRQLEDANTQLKGESLTDALTGIANRRALEHKLTEELARTARSPCAFSLMLLDVDHFKQFNNSFGHPAGDRALQTVARILQDSIRTSDFLARYGGEEFAILMPDTGREGAFMLADRCRRVMLETTWPHRPITISVGVATAATSPVTAEQLLYAADECLYRAKQAGRNTVMQAEA